MNMLRIFLILILTSSAMTATARMYQWLDPDNGTTQLSGKPPAWYRSSQRGPRVLVFENGRLIDDTGVRVSKTERDKLRRQAFLKMERDRAIAEEKALLARKRKMESAQKEQEQKVTEARDSTPDDQIEAEDISLSINAMRKMISDWERRRIENAKESIESKGDQESTLEIPP